MKETVLDVKGMSCSSCVRHVDMALKGVDGVKEVDVRLSEGRALVKHDPATDIAKLVGAIEEAGYEACPIS